MKKKLLSILALLITLVFIGCTNGVPQRIPLEEGDKRITITSDNYIIVETCTGFNGFGSPFWSFETIVRKDTADVNDLIFNKHVDK